MATPYRILSLDGGGIRGVVSMEVLRRFAEIRPTLLSEFDLIAGTSAGALNTLGLAFGLSPEQMIQFYKVQGPKIFPKDFVSATLSLNGVLSARFKTAYLRNGILSGVKESRVKLPATPETMTLESLVKTNSSGRPTRHLFTTFQLDSGPAFRERSWKAKIFHNFPNDNSLDASGNPVPNPDLKELAVNVAIRSSSAPGLFPICEGYVDGALLANNPSMCAIAQALNNQTGGQKDDDLRVLSIGTGKAADRYLTNKNDSWGFADWARHLNMFIDAIVGVASYQSRQVIGDCFFRADPLLSGKYDSGDGGAVERLLQDVDGYFNGPDGKLLLQKAADWLNGQGGGNWMS